MAALMQVFVIVAAPALATAGQCVHGRADAAVRDLRRARADAVNGQCTHGHSDAATAVRHLSPHPR